MNQQLLPTRSRLLLMVGAASQEQITQLVDAALHCHKSGVIAALGLSRPCRRRLDLLVQCSDHGRFPIALQEGCVGGYPVDACLSQDIYQTFEGLSSLTSLLDHVRAHRFKGGDGDRLWCHNHVVDMGSCNNVPYATACIGRQHSTKTLYEVRKIFLRRIPRNEPRFGGVWAMVIHRRGAERIDEP